MRRQFLLTSAATLATLNWHKPIVNSVFTPAHAQTSNIFPAGGFSAGGICFEFSSAGNVGRVNIKLDMGSNVVVQDDFEVDLNNLPPQIGGALTKDCNGADVDSGTLILIDSYSPSRVLFRFIQGKIGPQTEALPGGCNLPTSCS